MNYGVSMTNLNEVFLNLEGKSASDEPGIKMCVEQKIKKKENDHVLIHIRRFLCGILPRMCSGYKIELSIFLNIIIILYLT